MCKNHRNWWFVFVVRILCRERSFLTISLAEILAWRHALAEKAESPSVDTDRKASSKVSCPERKWNKSNEQKIHYDTNAPNCIFEGKVSVPLSTVSFLNFLLKRLLNQLDLHHTERLGVRLQLHVFVYQLYLSLLFVSLLKIHLFF